MYCSELLCYTVPIFHGIRDFKTGKNKGVPLSERDLVLRQQPVSLHLSYPLKPPNILVLCTYIQF